MVPKGTTVNMQEMAEVVDELIDALGKVTGPANVKLSQAIQSDVNAWLSFAKAVANCYRFSLGEAPVDEGVVSAGIGGIQHLSSGNCITITIPQDHKPSRAWVVKINAVRTQSTAAAGFYWLQFHL